MSDSLRNASEIRKNWKQVLDECVHTAKPVFFQRAGQMFKIEPFVPGIPVPAVLHEDDGKSHNIRPDLKKNSSDSQANESENMSGMELQKAIEQSCCELKLPCRHWSYDDVMEVWVNSLSGRERQPNE